jgi:lipopolysaccharide transport system ATP-binding protein
MIRVTHISKEFKLYATPAHRLKELILRRSFHRRHKALNNISFEVAAGETLGILGRNGAGKSTLLKILNGVLLADSGEITVSGRITGLLELGTGFDYNLSGAQNILTNGLLLGMTREEIEARRADIIQFSELGRFIQEPIRTYSSGMTMRLAFSIAIHADPEVFLIDEALSVGDGHFQQKCMRRIQAFRDKGGAIIFVSHDLNTVKTICNRALVLSGGEIVADTDPEKAVNIYNRILASDSDPIDRSNNSEDYGNGDAIIESTVLMGESSGGYIVTSGEDVTLDIKVLSHKTIANVTLGIMIRDRFGQDVFGTNSYYLGVPINFQAGERKLLRYRFPMHIAPGKYTVTVALHDDKNHNEICYHWQDNSIGFEVAGIKGPQFSGCCNLLPVLSIHEYSS